MDMKQVVATRSDTSAQNTQYNLNPSECPVCLQFGNPRILGGATHLQTQARAFLEVAYQCVNPACGQLFIGRFAQTSSSVFAFETSVPRTIKAPLFEPELAGLSPSFNSIFTEASAAEAYGLAEIAGVGYRKALEFLIKDYCCTQTDDPKVQDEIRRLPLMACIKKFVKDEEIKDCAERATWLGNDETHYVRLWDEYDIQSLKALIKLTTDGITRAVRIGAFRERMAEGRKQ